MYLITNRHLCTEERYIEVIEESILNGVDNIIIREKDLEYKELKQLYIKIKNKVDYINQQKRIIKRNFDNKSNKIYMEKLKVNFIINSNIKLFEDMDCQGIHLPFTVFLNLLGNRYNFNKNKILGLSVHKIEEVEYLNEIIKEFNIKIDYIMLSHVYETKCKESLEPKGIEFLKKAQKITDIKIVALGGILPSNIKKTLKYCDDFAVMSTIMKSKNIEKTILEYVEKSK